MRGWEYDASHGKSDAHHKSSGNIIIYREPFLQPTFIFPLAVDLLSIQFLLILLYSLGLPYSEHSSFEELQWFVKLVKPKQVISTVGKWSERRSAEQLALAWTHEAEKDEPRGVKRKRPGAHGFSV